MVNNKNNNQKDNDKLDDINMNNNNNKKTISKKPYDYNAPINPYESDPTVTLNYHIEKPRGSFNNLWR